MKKIFKRKERMIFILCSMILLTGCKVNTVIQRLPSDIPGLTEENNVKEIPLEELSAKDIGYENIMVKTNSAIESKDVKRLITIFDLGELDVYATDKENIEVQYYLGYDGKLSDRQKEFFDKIDLKMVTKNNAILIESLLPNGYNGFNINLFDNKRYSFYMKIGVPKQIIEFSLSNNIGKTKIKDIQATMRLSNNVGLVELENITPIESLYVMTNVGKVNCDIKDTSNLYEIYGIANVGSLDINLPKDTKYEELNDKSVENTIETIAEVIEQVTESSSENLFEEWESVEKTDSLKIFTQSNIGNSSING